MNLALSESLGQELQFAKKNQLKRSYETQITMRRSSNLKLFEIKFNPFKNMLSGFTG